MGYQEEVRVRRESMDVDLEHSVAELYRGPREQFVARRRELAEVFKATVPDEAAWVSKLKKPSVLAWSINRFRADHAETFAALVQSGESLRTALQLGDPSGAMAERRTAVEQALECIDQDWSQLGTELSVSQRRKLAATLEALSVGSDSDEEVAAGLAGRLVRDLNPPGLESLVGLVVGEARASGRAPSMPAARKKRARSASEDAADEKKKLAAARANLTRSQKALAALELEGEAARNCVLEVQNRLAEVRAQRAELRGRIEKARGTARRAERAVASLERARA